MNASNLAFLDTQPGYRVAEDKGSYDADAHAAAAEHGKHLYKAQGLVGDALNLAGLVLKSLEDEGDARAMQIEAAVRAIETTLQKAHRQIDRHEARYTKLFLQAKRGDTS
jgi:hypothetical protein